MTHVPRPRLQPFISDLLIQVGIADPDRRVSLKNRFDYAAGCSPSENSMTFQEACRVLQLPRDCTLDSAKKAYRKLSRTHHPDKGGDAAEFTTIAQAFAAIEKHFN